MAGQPELEFDNLRAIKLLGKGAMGTVFLVHDKSRDPSAHHPVALKVVEKASAVHNADRRARQEISVLNRLRSASVQAFLPNLIGSSETQEFICWAIPFCPGGDLNELRYRQIDRVFSPAVIRFYLAEIICALEYLHSQGIVYRDLKPENILVQESGHVTLTDFDLSRDLVPRKTGRIEFSDPEEDKSNNNPKHCSCEKRLKKANFARVCPVNRRINIQDSPTNERSISFVGTLEYMAPEVIRGDGHEFAVDWWALGVLCYEMLYGKTPFKGKNRKETFSRILFAEPEFIGKPSALTDLIKKLLEKDPTLRLGYLGGAREIKAHDFFRGLRWDLLTDVLRPPFLPPGNETEAAEGLKEGGINISDYFRNLKLRLSPPLCLAAIDECEFSISITEF